MHNLFSYTVKKSITGVHITLSGNLTKKAVIALASCILQSHTVQERLFLDVRKLTIANDAVCQDFKNCIEHIPSRQIIFKGEQGVRLGNQGCRVLFMKDSPCKCNGACVSCACDKRVQSRKEKFNFTPWPPKSVVMQSVSVG